MMQFNERLLNLPIGELELSVRTVNCLKAAGFLTIGQVVNVMNEDHGRALLKLKNFGRKSFNELRETFGSLVNSRERELLSWVASHGAEIEAVMDGRAAIVPTWRGMLREDEDVVSRAVQAAEDDRREALGA